MDIIIELKGTCCIIWYNLLLQDFSGCQPVAGGRKTKCKGMLDFPVNTKDTLVEDQKRIWATDI